MFLIICTVGRKRSRLTAVRHSGQEGVAESEDSAVVMQRLQKVCGHASETYGSMNGTLAVAEEVQCMHQLNDGRNQ